MEGDAYGRDKKESQKLEPTYATYTTYPTYATYLTSNFPKRGCPARPA